MNVRASLAIVALSAAFAGLFSALAPAASAVTTGGGGSGRYPHASCDLSGGAVNPDLTWVGHVVGCDTDVDPQVVSHLILLRDAICEGITAHVPAARMVNVTAAELGGNRTEAVTLFTAASVYCYGGR